jgi:hypothetical protein
MRSRVIFDVHTVLRIADETDKIATPYYDATWARSDSVIPLSLYGVTCLSVTAVITRMPLHPLVSDYLHPVTIQIAQK